jgi:AraC family transcriptional regulator
MPGEQLMSLSPHLQRVLLYIDQQLAAEIAVPVAAQSTEPNENCFSIQRLSEVAHWSKFHFQRQFFSQCGLSVQSYLRLLRLLRAASQLSFRETSLTEIAAESGYEHSESFSRAFRRLLQQAPIAFRDNPDWLQWQQQLEYLATVRSLMQQHPPIVDIIDFEQTPIALLLHRGSPALLGMSIRRFIEFRKQQQLPPNRSATFNLLYDDPRLSAPDEYRFGLAAATPQHFELAAAVSDWPEISCSEIPAGRCARIQHTGDDQQLGMLVDYLYQNWLAQNGEQAADYPIVLQRKVFFPKVPAHLAQTDILLLLQ